MKTRNRRYPRSSGMDGDKSGESGVFLFSRRVPDFCDGRRPFPTNENSILYRWGRWRWISLITNLLNCWAPVPLSRDFQFFAPFPFPAKFIGRIWVWLVAIIRYIWDGRQKVKSPIVLDFPNVWKPGFISRRSLILNNKKLNTVICVLTLVGSIKFLDLTFHRASWSPSLFFSKL